MQVAGSTAVYNIIYSHQALNQYIVLINLPASIVQSTNSSIMVTLLSNSTEIPLPYIYVPSMVENINYIIDYMYCGKTVSSMNSLELKDLLEEILKGKAAPQSIKPIGDSYDNEYYVELVSNTSKHYCSLIRRPNYLFAG